MGTCQGSKDRCTQSMQRALLAMHFGTVFQAKRRPKTVPKPPSTPASIQERFREPRTSIFRPCWAHFGPMLVPCWAQQLPRAAQEGPRHGPWTDPERPRSGPGPPRGPRGPPGGLQRPILDRKSSQLGPMLALFLDLILQTVKGAFFCSDNCILCSHTCTLSFML